MEEENNIPRQLDLYAQVLSHKELKLTFFLSAWLVQGTIALALADMCSIFKTPARLHGLGSQQSFYGCDGE